MGDVEGHVPAHRGYFRVFVVDFTKGGVTLKAGTRIHIVGIKNVTARFRCGCVFVMTEGGLRLCFHEGQIYSLTDPCEHPGADAVKFKTMHAHVELCCECCCCGSKQVEPPAPKEAAQGEAAEEAKPQVSSPWL